MTHEEIRRRFRELGVWQRGDRPLCSLHHQLFDRGVFTLDDEHRSGAAMGTERLHRIEQHSSGGYVKRVRRATHLRHPPSISGAPPPEPALGPYR